MWPYVLVATIVYFFGIFEVEIGQRRISNSITVIIVAILVVFAGLKVGGATDYFEYKRLYDTFEIDSSSKFLEPGFIFFMYLCHTAGYGFLLFYFLVACVSISIKGKAIYKLAPIVSAAFLIYFSGCFFERDNDGIRQGLSMAFCLLALVYLSKDKNLKYLIFTAIAAIIHYSSIVFLLAWFLKKLRCQNRTLAIIIIISFIVSITGHYITPYLISNVPIVMAASKLEYYSTTSSYSGELGITIGLVFRTLLLFLFMANMKKLTIDSGLYYLLRNGLAIAIIFSLLFGDFVIIAHRLPYVFREFQIFIVSYLVSSLPNKGTRIVGLSVVYVYTLILLSRFFTEGSVYNNYSNLLFQ